MRKIAVEFGVGTGTMQRIAVECGLRPPRIELFGAVDSGGYQPSQSDFVLRHLK
jgi:hypothetical protein